MIKKICIAFSVLLIVAATIFFMTVVSGEGQSESDYLRIHVRANSNSAQDQEVKYEVRDEVVKFLTPHIAECVTKSAAIEVMQGLLPEITEVCEKALVTRGYTYGARASVREEKFPTRVYDDLTLEEGVYDALIIELGTGKGDNWWCVIYPPLCFTSATGDVGYRSLIYDIINNFFKN